MKASLPKQYLKVCGRAILEVTLQKLLAVPQLQGVVVALHPEDRWFEQLNLPTDKVVRVTGGCERAHSVLNALNYLNNRVPEAWALVHDAARPCVELPRIAVLIQAVQNQVQKNGAILAVPAADTLKQVADNQIQKTVDRAVIWQAHTPQLFFVDKLNRALEAVLEKGLSITDEASAIELLGERPLVVEDSRTNLKITRPEDLAIAEILLKQQGWC